MNVDKIKSGDIVSLKTSNLKWVVDSSKWNPDDGCYDPNIVLCIRETDKGIIREEFNIVNLRKAE